MFMLLVLSILIASFIEDRDELVPSTEYALEENNSEGLLANMNTRK